MLPNKAKIEMDGQQIKLQIAANELAYKAACYRQDFHQANQYRIMNDLLALELKQFHEQHAKAFAERYPIHIHIHVGGQTREG
ncbi:hypothetical protein [Paenibacillus periandrae]|uniref:hypothetical protein n=1 Tax=Paenibacillus periandrae TaxID=1761741 RepID=UPI001F08D5A7|nr:hypothetical protein [Paenibacillus periandrae]